MSKFFILMILTIFLSVPTYAIDSSLDLNDNSKVFNDGFSEQKPITDSKFKKTVEQLKERSLTNKQKKIRAEVQPNSPAFDNEHLKTFVNSQNSDNGLSQTLTVMIPVKACSDDGKYIQPGYYKLSCRKISKDTYVLDLSQGTQRILTVKANQTEQDLEQDTIQFCNAEVISNNRIRLMYGNIDLNLVGYLYFD